MNDFLFSIRQKPGKWEVHLAFRVGGVVTATMQIGEFLIFSEAADFVENTALSFDVERVTYDPMAPFIIGGR